MWILLAYDDIASKLKLLIEAMIMTKTQISNTNLKGCWHSLCNPDELRNFKGVIFSENKLLHNCLCLISVEVSSKKKHDLTNSESIFLCKKVQKILKIPYLALRLVLPTPIWKPAMLNMWCVVRFGTICTI